MSPALDLRTLDRPLDAIDVLLLVAQVSGARAAEALDPACGGPDSALRDARLDALPRASGRAQRPAARATGR